MAGIRGGDKVYDIPFVDGWPPACQKPIKVSSEL